VNINLIKHSVSFKEIFYVFFKFFFFLLNFFEVFVCLIKRHGNNKESYFTVFILGGSF
jgi:hypothetical protein